VHNQDQVPAGGAETMIWQSYAQKWWWSYRNQCYLKTVYLNPSYWLTKDKWSATAHPYSKCSYFLKKKKVNDGVSGWLSRLSVCLRLRSWSQGPRIKSRIWPLVCSLSQIIWPQPVSKRKRHVVNDSRKSYFNCIFSSLWSLEICEWNKIIDFFLECLWPIL